MAESTTTTPLSARPPAPVAPATAKQLAQAQVGDPKAPPPVHLEPPTMTEIFFASDDGDKVDMRLLMLSLWKNRRNAQFTQALCQRLASLAISDPTLDQVEFYLPQLAHMVIHLEHELPIEDMEQFVLLLSQSSVHFALQLFWIIYAALDENRPKRQGNPRTFARCAQLLLALEQCVVYGSPVAREATELLTRNSISRAEMDQILRADRRFFAAQGATTAAGGLGDGTGSGAGGPEGWLYKKGGGTSAMGRRNWKLRWCRLERRVLLVFTRPSDTRPRTAVPLDRAEVRLVDNPRHPFYFELIHEFSETTMKFAAQSQEDLVAWIQHLHRAAAAPEPPRSAAASPSSGRTSPDRTLARMSMAMRSFILQSGAGAGAGAGAGTASSAPPTPSAAAAASGASSPPPSPTKADMTTRTAAAATPPGSPSKGGERATRQLRARSSVVSATSSEAGEASAVHSESLLVLPQPPLPFDQQRRYEFFTGMINFVKAITDVSESLRRVEPAKRKALLRPRLEQLRIPPLAYIPLCKSTDPFCRVRAAFTTEGRVFSTNERAPCLLYFDTEANDRGQDVSRALFENLYEDEPPNDEDIQEGDDENLTAIADDADLDAALPIPSSSDSSESDGGGEPTAESRPTGSFNYTSYTISPFLRELLANPERKQRIEKVFGELSFTSAERLQRGSKCENPVNWRLCTLIAKSYDDLRQEVLVMQLISYFHHIFQLERLPLRLHPYRILSTGASTGLLEVVRNATSLDGIKKTPGFKNLRSHFEHLYGGSVDGERDGAGAEMLRQAELNFIHSLAAYSIVCYILSIKDRHNGNIMLDVEGHIIHIDFGFFLGRAPGGSFSFETAPFKLTAEMVDVLGGRSSSQFTYFSDLCVKGALAARRHAETIYTLVEVMSFHSKLPCFISNTAAALAGLRERLFLTIPEDRVESTILQMIDRAYDHFGTNKYDQFQVYSNGIAK